MTFVPEVLRLNPEDKLITLEEVIRELADKMLPPELNVKQRIQTIREEVITKIFENYTPSNPKDPKAPTGFTLRFFEPHYAIFKQFELRGQDHVNSLRFSIHQTTKLVIDRENALAAGVQTFDERNRPAWTPFVRREPAFEIKRISLQGHDESKKRVRKNNKKPHFAA